MNTRLFEWGAFDKPWLSCFYIVTHFLFQYVHPGYNPANFRNDVALVRLQDEVVFKEHISPVCLPSYEQSFIHQYAKVIGWGRTQHGT